MVLDTTSLIPRHYKGQIKGKVVPSPVLSIEKGAFVSPSTTVANFTYFYIEIIIN